MSKFISILTSCFLLIILSLPAVQAEDLVLARQDKNKQWVEIVVPAEPVQALRKSLTVERVSSKLVANGITFNIAYEDDGTGFGFGDAGLGATRKATLEAVLTYVASVINESATIDILCELSGNSSGSSTLATAGTYYFTSTNGFKDGIATQHLITGTDPIPGTEDIFVFVNFGKTWNSDLSAPSGGEFDLYSVLLHEITHGLGINSTISATGVGSLFEKPKVFTSFDALIEDNAGTKFINATTFDPQGTISDLTTGSCFFVGTQAVAFAGQRVPVNTPDTFSDGSSIAHWDTAFNSLAVMNPTIAVGVSKRFYSDVELYALFDLGYSVTVYSDLALSVSVPSNANTFTDLDYAITLTNNGPFGATGVQVAAPLPANTVFGSDDAGGDYTSGSGIWNVGTLASGASITLTITHQLSQVGTFSYQAEVSAADLADPDSSVNNGQNSEDDSATATLYSGFMVSETQVNVAEDLRTESFTVVLSGDPGGTPVVIRMTEDDGDNSEIQIDSSAGPVDLTFTTADWDEPQTVTVSGLDDSVIDGTKTVTITLDVFSGPAEFTALGDKTVVAYNEDDGEGAFIFADQVIINGTVQLNNTSDFQFSVTGNATGEATGNDWTATIPLDVDGSGDAVLKFKHAKGSRSVPITITETLVPMGGS